MKHTDTCNVNETDHQTELIQISLEALTGRIRGEREANRVKPKLKCDGYIVRQTSLSVFVICYLFI